MAEYDSLVTSKWLRDRKKTGSIKVLDASYHRDRNTRMEFLTERIEGAVFFDIDEIADESTPLPAMLPSPQQFSEQVGKLGISNDDHVVVYDNDSVGLYSAPRVWWTFRVFGHTKVSVLDGGLPNWKAHGYPVVHSPPPPITPAHYSATFNPNLVRSMAQMLENFTSRKEQVVDARSRGRYEGTDPEPNPAIPSGHMIGSSSIPYMDCLDPESRVMKEKHLLKEEFEKAGVDLDRPVVTTCGSGMTAAVVTLAAYLLGKELPIYDGSWTEWVECAPEETKVIGIRN